MEQSATNQKKSHRDAAAIEKQIAALVTKDEKAAAVTEKRRAKIKALRNSLREEKLLYS